VEKEVRERMRQRSAIIKKGCVKLFPLFTWSVRDVDKVITTFCPFCNKTVPANLTGQAASLNLESLRWALNNQEPLDIGHVFYDDATGKSIDHIWTANPEERKMLSYDSSDVES
jgi:hypothetical protein